MAVKCLPIAVLATYLTFCTQGVVPTGDDTITAECVIAANSGNSPIEGKVTFTQKVTGGEVTVTVAIRGFNKSDDVTDHGFHIHTNGDLGNKCGDSGGHYNPNNVAHGDRSDTTRHVGDLGNIVEDGEGEVMTVFKDDVLQLIGANNIVGKSVVVHAGTDDLGRGGAISSNTTGDAGSRMGCCRITTTDDSLRTATCVVASDSGRLDAPIEGTVTFKQFVTGGSTEITINLEGFDTTDNITKHGFHIHQNGSLGMNCGDAMGHYNPTRRYHGAPNDSVPRRHVGDLGNIIEKDDGTVMMELNDTQVALWGNRSVIGRSIVIHAGEDDLGKKNTTFSMTTGDAGGRLACCIILEDIYEATTVMTRETTTTADETTTAGGNSAYANSVLLVLTVYTTLLL